MSNFILFIIFLWVGCSTLQQHFLLRIMGLMRGVTKTISIFLCFLLLLIPRFCTRPGCKLLCTTIRPALPKKEKNPQKPVPLSTDNIQRLDTDINGK